MAQAPAPSYAVDPSVVSQIQAINPRQFSGSAYQSQPWGPGSAQSDIHQFDIGGQSYYFAPEGRFSTGGSRGTATVDPGIWAQGTPFTATLRNPQGGGINQNPYTLTQQGRLFASDPFASNPLGSYTPGKGGDFFKADLASLAPLFIAAGAAAFAPAAAGSVGAGGAAAEGGFSTVPTALGEYAAGTGATAAGASSTIPYEAWAASMGGGAAAGGAAAPGLINAADPGYVMPGAEAASSGATGGIQAELPTWGGTPLSGEAGRNLAGIAGGGAETGAVGSFLSSFGSLFGGGGFGGLGGAGGGSTLGTISNALGIGSSVYGLYEADQMRKLAKEQAKAADPFGPWRAGYGQQLNTLMNDPSKILEDPGYKTSVQATRRAMAKGGYTMSGNELIGLQNNFGNYYDQQVNRLATLAGAGMGGGNNYRLQGEQYASDLTGRSLANLGLLAYRAGV